MKCKSCGVVLNGAWREVYYQNGILCAYLQCLTCYGSRRKSSDSSSSGSSDSELYSCSICTKSFSVQNHLLLHLAIHAAMVRKDTKLEDSITLDADGIVPFDFELCPQDTPPIPQQPVKIANFPQVIFAAKLLPKSKLKVNCPVCEAECSSLKRLKSHCRSLHSAQMPFSCAVCSMGFPLEILLLRHFSRLHSAINDDCDCHHCGSLAQKYSADRLKRKTRQFLGGRVYDCPFCAKLLSDASGLRQHLRSSHTPITTPITCQHCQQPFNFQTELNRHSRVCKLRLPCRQCPARFASNYQLNLHTKEAHYRAKPYRCDVCRKGFSDRPNLKSHQKSHLVNKPLNCPICQRKFTSVQQWEHHGHIHNAEKPFYCNLCHRHFRRRHHILRHCR